MPRRRSSDPTTDIRITIPMSVLSKIHEELGHKDSRSAWISKACRMRLAEERPGLDEYSTMRLLSEVRYRGNISYDKKDIITLWLDELATSSNPDANP